MGPKVSKASGKKGNWKNFRRTCHLSSWLLLQLLSQRKRMWRSDMRLHRCRWRSRLQVAQHPSFHGVSVKPSGPLPSTLKRPCGTMIEGNPALESERQIRSFTKHKVMALWSTRVSSARERMRATSVDWGPMHRYGLQSSEPSRRPTATLKSSLFRRSPLADIGTAWSQSPLCAAGAARRLLKPDSKPTNF